MPLAIRHRSGGLAISEARIAARSFATTDPVAGPVSCFAAIFVRTGSQPLIDAVYVVPVASHVAPAATLVAAWFHLYAAAPVVALHAVKQTVAHPVVAETHPMPAYLAMPIAPTHFVTVLNAALLQPGYAG